MKRIIMMLILLLGSLLSIDAPAAPARVPAPFAARVVGHGPPVILIPGLASPGSIWDGLVQHMAARHECHLLTLAGFAGEPPLTSEAPYLATERDAIIAYARALRLKRPILVGHSLGGFLAFWIAATVPDEVGPIVAVDGVPWLMALSDQIPTANQARAQAERMRAFFASLSSEAFARQNSAALAAMITSAEDVQRVATAAAKSAPKTVGEAIYEMMTTDLRQDVARIRTPVLLIGAADGARDAYEAQVERVRAHTVVMAERTRHFVMLDNLSWLKTRIDAFLGDVP